MGTHPIFESDFDCLTENIKKVSQNLKRKMSKKPTNLDYFVDVEGNLYPKDQVTPELRASKVLFDLKEEIQRFKQKTPLEEWTKEEDNYLKVGKNCQMDSSTIKKNFFYFSNR